MGSQRFVKFVKSSSEVRQVCQKFVRFVRSSSSSSKVRQVRQKFVKFVRSSSSSSKVRQVRQKFVKFVGSLGGGPIGSQNNLFFLFWWTKQLIFLDFGWQTTYFVVKKWDLTNFWRTSDELDELLTNFWRTWRTFDELDELLTNLTNFWRTFDELLTNFWRTSNELLTNLTSFWRTFDELLTNLTNFRRTWRTSKNNMFLWVVVKSQQLAHVVCFFSVGLSENISAETVRLKLCESTKLYIILYEL